MRIDTAIKKALSVMPHINPLPSLCCCITLMLFLGVAVGQESPIVVEAENGAPVVTQQAETESRVSKPAAPPDEAVESVNLGTAEAPLLTPTVLTLEEAQRIALRENPNLEVAAAIVAQAQTKVQQVRSMYLPQIAAEYRQTYTWLANNKVDEFNEYYDTVEDFLEGYKDTLPSLEALTPQTMTLDTLSNAWNILQARRSARNLTHYLEDWRETINNRMDGGQLTLTAGWLLFDGFARECSMAMARYGKRETEAARLEAQRLILAAVAQAYYGVQLAREGDRIADANLEFTERLVKEAERRYELGKGSRSDMLSFRVRQYQARSGKLDITANLAAARVALAVLLNLPQATLPECVDVASLTPEGPKEMTQPDEAVLIAYALDHRPELIQGGYSIKRAEATAKQKKAAYAPQVGLFAQLDGQRLRHSSLEGDDFSSTVGFNISYDIFTGGRRHAQVKEARHQQREAQYRLAAKEQEITGEIKNACIELSQSQQQLILQRASTKDIQENRDLEEKAYNAGKGALLRLTLAQRDLVEAQARLAVARVSLIQNWYKLRSLTGEILGEYDLSLDAEE